MVPLLPYRSWDYKPLVNGELMSLITPDELSAARTSPEPGEVELLDGLMLMERGDYAGAVRRVVTAMEVIVESRLRVELERLYPSAEVERRLTASQNDFPGRLRQWVKLSRNELPEPLVRELEQTRALRHAIVTADSGSLIGIEARPSAPSTRPVGRTTSSRDVQTSRDSGKRASRSDQSGGSQPVCTLPLRSRPKGWSSRSTTRTVWARSTSETPPPAATERQSTGLAHRLPGMSAPHPRGTPHRTRGALRREVGIPRQGHVGCPAVGRECYTTPVCPGARSGLTDVPQKRVSGTARLVVATNESEEKERTTQSCPCQQAAYVGPEGNADELIEARC